MEACGQELPFGRHAINWPVSQLSNSRIPIKHFKVSLISNNCIGKTRCMQADRVNVVYAIGLFFFFTIGRMYIKRKALFSITSGSMETCTLSYIRFSLEFNLFQVISKMWFHLSPSAQASYIHFEDRLTDR